MSVKNVSHDLTIEVVENINQTFCGGQVVGVKYIILYHIYIYNNGKYSKEYSVFKYKHLHQTTDTTDHEPPTAFLKTFFLPTAEKVVEI